MSRSYAENRIREALKLSKGNSVKARQLIAEWCRQDQRLLQTITAPHMTGILAHAIDRVTKKVARGEPAPAEEAVVYSQKEDKDFGKELLKNLGMGKPAMFAQEGFSAPIKKRKASQSHIDTIHMLAGRKKRP